MNYETDLYLFFTYISICNKFEVENKQKNKIAKQSAEVKNVYYFLLKFNNFN